MAISISYRYTHVYNFKCYWHYYGKRNMSANQINTQVVIVEEE